MSLAPSTHQPSSFGRAIGLAIAAAAVVCVVLLAFAWPSITSDPHDIPVGIVGGDEQVKALETHVAEQSDGAFALERFEDRDAAVGAIEQREVYGAIILADVSEGSADMAASAPEVLIATAANSAVAQMLQSMAVTMQAQISTQVNTAVEAQVNTLIDTLKAALSGQGGAAAASGAEAASAGAQLPETFAMPDVQVTVTDVVPLSEDDPRGAGLAAAALPLVMGGMIGAMIISTAIHGSRRRLVALIVYTLAAGLALTAILES